MEQPTTNRYQFGPYVLDEDDRQIKCGEKVVHLQPKDFDVLLFLLKRNGQLASKQDIMDAVWGDVVVTENSLTRSILQLRLALGDNTETRLYIETVPTLGYRMACDVESLSGSPRSTKQFSTRVAIGVAALALVVVAVVIGLYQSGSNPALSETDVPVSIAILPFTDMSESQNQSYLSNGLAEQLTTALSNIRGLEVASRTSSSAMSEADMDVQFIGDALNVKYVLESSVVRDGERIRITTQLIETGTGFHIWTEEYNREFNNIFDLLDDATRDITDALKIQLFQKEPTLRLANTGTKSAAALNYKMLGDEALKGMPDSFDQVLAYYDQAIELDPEYFGAYRSKAWAYVNSLPYDFGMSPKEAYAIALAILEEAQKHDFDGRGARSRSWEDRKASFDLENTKPQQIQKDEVVYRERLISYHDTVHTLEGYAGYSLSLFRAGLFHTARVYIEKYDPLTPGAKAQLVGILAAGGGTQEETLDLLSDLIATGEASPARIATKARFLYKMGRAEEAEELFTEIDAGITRGWPESLASLLGTAYLGEPLSETMLEFVINNLPRAVPGAAYLISGGYVDEGLELLERGAADESNPDWLSRIRSITSGIWREDVKQEMMANERFLNILDSIGVGENWRYEHARRAMSISSITGIEVDPRDLE